MMFTDGLLTIHLYPANLPKNGAFIENPRGAAAHLLDVRGVRKRRTGTRLG
jgi:hypothetical protein